MKHLRQGERVQGVRLVKLLPVSASVNVSAEKTGHRAEAPKWKRGRATGVDVARLLELYTYTDLEEERRELEKAARKYTSPYNEVIRARIVLYAAEGLQNDAIASRLDTPRQIVSKWRKRFFEERLDGLRDEPRRGRPARFSPQHRGRS
jgi:hypothetical protein